MLKQVFTKMLQEGGALNTNQMARHLYTVLDRNDFMVRVKRIEGIEGRKDEYYGKDSLYGFSDIVNYQDSEVYIPESDSESEEKKDYRFTGILVNGIKKIPVEVTSKKLTFSESNKAVTSAVIMGANGVGKSTFYGALELLGMGAMKTAEIYGLASKDYFQNCFSRGKQAKAILHTVTTTFSLNTDRLTPNCLPAFFISEWDIRALEKIEDCGDYIFSQLGVENFRNLLNLLQTTLKEFKDTNLSYQQAVNEANQYERKVNQLKDLLLHNIIPNQEPEEESLKDSWNKYKDQHDDLAVDLMALHAAHTQRQNQIDKNEGYTVISQIANPDERISQLEEIISKLKDVFNQKIEGWIKDVLNPIFTKLLEEYLKDEGEEISLEYDPGSYAITAKLIVTPFGEQRDEGNGVETNPGKYFNTFRFKMFVVALKIALACCAKVIYGENWPIVIDDVFSSSDFNNRSRMGEFISQLINSYKNLPDVKDYEFQLIFFTQDDVIGEAVFGGLKEQDMNARLMRLHDYRCFGKWAINHAEEENQYIDVGTRIDQYLSETEKEVPI